MPSVASLRMPVTTERYTELACDQDMAGFLTPLIYNILIIIICAVLGYLSRKLPENYNESWFIFLSVSSTLFLWLVMLPSYFMAFYAYQQAAILAFCLIIISYFTAILLYAPKLYGILFVSEDTMHIAATVQTTSTIVPSSQ